MNLTLYFLRHGETTYSQVGCYCGNLDPHLTEVGREMAEAFTAHYARAIYVSPMTRTMETAQPLRSRIGKEMILREGLTGSGRA